MPRVRKEKNENKNKKMSTGYFSYRKFIHGGDRREWDSENIPTSILMRYDTNNQDANDFLGENDKKLILYPRNSNTVVNRDGGLRPEDMQKKLKTKCENIVYFFKQRFKLWEKDATQLTLLWEEEVLDGNDLSELYDLKCTVKTYVRAQSNLLVALELQSPRLSNAINYYVSETIDIYNNFNLFLHSKDYLQRKREDMTPKQYVLYNIYDLEARASINQGILDRFHQQYNVANRFQRLEANVIKFEGIWNAAIDHIWQKCRNFLQALQYVESVTENEFIEEDKDDEDNDEDKDEEQTLLQAIGTSIGNWFNPQNEEDDQKEVDEYNEELLEDARERRDKYNAETIQQDEIQRAVDAERQEGQLPNTLPEGMKKYFDNQQIRAQNRREDEKRKAFERERQKQEMLANLKNGVRRNLAMPDREHSRQIAALRRSDAQAAAQRSNTTTPVQFPHSESKRAQELFDQMFKEVQDDDDDL